jgi:hypothetical protein
VQRTHGDAAHVDLGDHLGAVARGAQVLAEGGAELAHEELPRHRLDGSLHQHAHHRLLRLRRREGRGEGHG